MKTIQLFFRWIKGNKISLFISLIILFFLDYIRSLVPVIISTIYAILDPNSDYKIFQFIESFVTSSSVVQNLIAAILIFLVIVIVRDLLNLFYDFMMARTSEGVGERIQTNFFKHVQRLPYTFLNNTQTGDLIQRSTSDINRFKRFIGNVLPNMLNSILLIAFYFYQMIQVDFNLALVSILASPILFIFSYFYFKKMEPMFIKLEENEGQLTSIAQENLTGIRVVKAFSNESHEISKFKKAVHQYTSSWMKQMKKISLYWCVTDVLTFSQLVFSFLISIYFYNQGVSMAGLLLVFICLQDILWRSRNLGRQISELSKTSISSVRLMEIMDEPDEFALCNGSLTPLIKGTIEFKNVSFCFEDSKIPTLKNISFKIHEGETIAIVGKTGSGKTTLTSLINRLIEPTTGEVLIDGVNSKEIEKLHLRKNVGMCMQEPFLYSKTVKENIGILKVNMPDSIIYEVAKTSSIDGEIKNFTHGYETIVGERGVTLSGGQKQRIAIARILTDNKPILIFDDSLSAVDTKTDKAIREGLNKRKNKTTTLIITHKINSAKDADKIIVLENGQISEIGTHDELIQVHGIYKTIYDIQTYFNEEVDHHE